MPHHASFFSYVVALFPALRQNIDNLGRLSRSALDKTPIWPHSIEVLAASTFIAALVIVLALLARSRLGDVEDAVIPDGRLTLRTFMELFIGYFYDMMKDTMGPKRAKRYFPLIGTCACFIFFANIIGLIPGFAPPTSSLNITAGCSIVVFFAFNYYGIKEHGLGYFKHLAGPVWWLAPLIFVIEVLSLCIRPVTLSIRLMVNMAVDHLLGTIVTGMVMLFVPIPIMMLGTLVCVVQVLVFCLLATIYIALATEHEDHGEAHEHAHEHGGPASHQGDDPRNPAPARAAHA
jgi:F-type H+-transporting ATPase subunit a